MKGLLTIAALMAVISCPVSALAAPDRTSSPVEIRTGDVALFYQIYDAAAGAPAGPALQRAYIDGGSDGVRQFVPNRIVSGAHLAEVVASERQHYEDARRCVEALPGVKEQLEQAFLRLAKLVPDAAFPPVTILIGADNSGGTTGPSGVLIGLEVACRADWLGSDVTQRLVHLIAHEYGHVEQPAELDSEVQPGPVLRASLVEGVVELVAELISGDVSNAHLAVWTRGREKEIDERFLRDANDTDLSHWLYNGVGTPSDPGDLGYWVGYRIARAYYDKSADKRAALKTLLALKDPQGVLTSSGWTPGMTIQ